MQQHLIHLKGMFVVDEHIPHTAHIYEMKGWRRGKQDEEMRKKTKINYIQTSSANKKLQVLLAHINVVITAAQCFGSTGLSTRDFKHVFVMMQLCVCFRCLGENKSQNPP